jgi:hypothetical protein
MELRYETRLPHNRGLEGLRLTPVGGRRMVLLKQEKGNIQSLISGSIDLGPIACEA